MASIFDWSTTAANNATADSGINFAEGQAPSTVNNSARQVMGRVAEIVGDLGGALVAGGTANALTVTANSAFTTNVNGRFLAFRAASDNSAAATLNVNAIGAKSIRKMTRSGDAALTGAEIQADGVYLLQYSEALNSAAGGWLLVNPTQIEVVTATTSVAGVSELATDAEAIARSAADRVITASNLAAAVGPASSTDNAIARFDSTSGKLQNSGVVISDTNAVTGIVGLTSAGDITASSADILASNFLVGGSGIYSRSSAGTVLIRPNGKASATGQVSVATDGAVTINGTLTVTG